MRVLPCPRPVPMPPAATHGAEDSAALPGRPSSRPRWPAAADPIRSPGPGACRARARRVGRTAASLPTASPAVPPPATACRRRSSENPASRPTPHRNGALPSAGGCRDRRELDRTAGGERASIRHRATRHAAPVGGSNRLLSVEELAVYLGVPRKPSTAAGGNGPPELPGRPVPAVPPAARGGVAPDQGGIATVAKIFKRCSCPEDQWDSCPHQWVVRYRLPHLAARASAHSR